VQNATQVGPQAVIVPIPMQKVIRPELIFYSLRTFLVHSRTPCHLVASIGAIRYA
jgi:hypothetical protein